MTTRFCRSCLKPTAHRSYTCLLGSRAGTAERVMHAVLTLGFSETIADKRQECLECGKVVRA